MSPQLSLLNLGNLQQPKTQNFQLSDVVRCDWLWGCETCNLQSAVVYINFFLIKGKVDLVRTRVKIEVSSAVGLG